MTDDHVRDGKVFISYSHTDSAVVHEICRHLTARGLAIWIDQTEGRAGDDIVEMMNRGLSESKLFLAFVGPTYFQNGRFTSAEFGAAFHKAMGAGGWRMIVVKLAPDVTLPPIAASRLYIQHSTPSETAHRIAAEVRTAERWDGPVYRSVVNGNSVADDVLVDFAGISDRDLEIVVTGFLDARSELLRRSGKILSLEVSLPQGRLLHMDVLRSIVENESIRMTLQDIAERISINQRFVSRYNQHLDEGLLGKFEVATEIALERHEKKLNDARAELRREMKEITEGAHIQHSRV